MRVEDAKQLSIAFAKPVTSILGVAAAIVTISLALANISVWVMGAFALVFGVLLSLVLYLYICKSRDFRQTNHRLSCVLRIFGKTHNTWHVYKRLSDAMHIGIDIEDARLRVHRLILNLASNFRDSLSLNHPDQQFRISMKAIVYKNVEKLEDTDGENYCKQPFVLEDLPLFRDAGQEAFREDEIIDKLDFDETTNKNEIDRLKKTLFYKSFVSRTVEFVNQFSGEQQTYTTRYRSGLVVPVVLHEIPHVLICVGSKETNIFGADDVEIACTFADAIAEFIRLDLVFHAIMEAQKVIVMDDANLLEDLTRNAADGRED